MQAGIGVELADHGLAGMYRLIWLLLLVRLMASLRARLRSRKVSMGLSERLVTLFATMTMSSGLTAAVDRQSDKGEDFWGGLAVEREQSALVDVGSQVAHAVNCERSIVNSK